MHLVGQGNGAPLRRKIALGFNRLLKNSV